MAAGARALDLGRDPLGRVLARLAAPVLGLMALRVAFNIVDVFWVGRLGAEAVAAVSTASFLVWLVHSLMELVVVGLVAHVARHMGQREPERAAGVAASALTLAALLGLAVGVAGLATVRQAFEFMSVPPAVLELGVGYMTILYVGAPLLYVGAAAEGAFRGSGDTLTPLFLLGGGLALNIVLDPCLILGLGPFPVLGVEGAALATVISEAAAALGALLLLARPKGARPAVRPRLGLDLRAGLALARVGLPIATSSALFCFVYILLTRVTSRFGTEALAALGIGHKLESLTYLPALALGAAVASLVGYNLGAGQPARATRAAWGAVAAISLVGGGFGALFVAMPERFVGFFIDDPRVLALGSSYLAITGLSQLLMGWEVVLEQAFGGAGDSLPPMLIEVPLTVGRIPLAWFLAEPCGLGAAGIWWAISASTMLKGLLLAIWFRRGRWQRARL